MAFKVNNTAFKNQFNLNGGPSESIYTSQLQWLVAQRQFYQIHREGIQLLFDKSAKATFVKQRSGLSAIQERFCPCCELI